MHAGYHGIARRRFPLESLGVLSYSNLPTGSSSGSACCSASSATSQASSTPYRSSPRDGYGLGHGDLVSCHVSHGSDADRSAVPMQVGVLGQEALQRRKKKARLCEARGCTLHIRFEVEHCLFPEIGISLLKTRTNWTKRAVLLQPKLLAGAVDTSKYLRLEYLEAVHGECI